MSMQYNLNFTNEPHFLYKCMDFDKAMSQNVHGDVANPLIFHNFITSATASLGFYQLQDLYLLLAVSILVVNPTFV